MVFTQIFTLILTLIHVIWTLIQEIWQRFCALTQRIRRFFSPPPPRGNRVRRARRGQTGRNRWKNRGHRGAFLFVNWGKNPLCFLGRVLDQGYWRICWAIGLVRQLEYMCKQRGLLAPNGSLSIQHLFDRIPNELLGDGLYLEGGVATVYPYILQGVVEEASCPLTCFRNDGPLSDFNDVPKFCPSSVEYTFAGKYDNYAEFLQDFFVALEVSPVAIGVLVGDTYRGCDGIRWVCPPGDEDFDPEWHLLLCIGRGINRKGKYFCRCQDSSGRICGKKGIVDFCLDRSQVVCFVKLEDVRSFM